LEVTSDSRCLENPPLSYLVISEQNYIEISSKGVGKFPFNDEIASSIVDKDVKRIERATLL
jgi:hypothetical protein